MKPYLRKSQVENQFGTDFYTMIKILKTGFVVILFCCNLSAFAQEEAEVPKWSIKLGYATYYNEDNIFNGGSMKFTHPSIRADANYRFKRFVESGIYLGYSSVSMVPKPPGGDVISANTPFLGIGANFHLLQLLRPRDNLRLDIYVRGEFGGHYYLAPDTYFGSGFKSDMAIGVGIAYYLGDHFGLFAEYTYGSYTDFRFGVSVKF
jgi:hypothetical protein